MSVLVQTRNEIKLFTKGSPESIKSICTLDTIPNNFDDTVKSYAKVIIISVLFLFLDYLFKNLK